jgi:hypothetical protein
MAGAGKKTFSAGETLTASDVNSYLMEQSVMYFGGTAARASAIPTPSTGMTSYIGVTGTAVIPQIESYTGAQWQTMDGMTLVASATIGTSVTSFTMDNVFSSRFTNYVIFFNGAQCAVVDGLNLQFRDAGGTIAGTNYFFNGIEKNAPSATLTARGGASVDAMRVGVAGGSNSNSHFFSCIKVYAPFLTQRSAISVEASTSEPITQGNIMYIGSGGSIPTTSYTGINFFVSGSQPMTGGTVRVYGVRNS